MTSRIKIWIFSALIGFGALVACSPLQTPVAIATATVIPSTPTATMTPFIPTESSSVSPTPVPNILTESPPAIPTILETTVELDIEFSRSIMESLADELTIPSDRVQIVRVEAVDWNMMSSDCVPAGEFSDGFTLSAYPGDDPVTGLRYLLLVGNTLYDYYTIGTERYVRCEGSELVSGEILLAVDPLAAETLRVVQNLLAGELDISSRRVEVVDMIPVTWTDTSLGCPQPDQTYTEIAIPGYHIVVTAGNESYIYHSDSNTAYPCPLEQSTIPAN